MTIVISTFITNYNQLHTIGWIGIIITELIFVAITTIRPKQADEENTQTKYDSLYYGRKYQADELINEIKNKRNGYAICIDGEWGSGKTYFVEGVLEKRREDEAAKNAKELKSAFDLRHDRFKREISNPRQLQKAANYCSFLYNVIEKQKKLCLKDTLSLDKFNKLLKDTCYEWHIAFLSLMYAFYKDEFRELNKEKGKQSYISSLEKRIKNSEINYGDDIDMVLHFCKYRWHLNNGLFREMEESLYNLGYEQDNLFRFIHHLLAEPTQLKNIASGFTELEQNIITGIESGVLNSDFIEMTEVIMTAPFNDEMERKNILIKMFELSASKINNDNVDNIFKIFSYIDAPRMYSKNTFFIYEFSSTFCKLNSNLSNAKEAKKDFILFSSEYTRHILYHVTSYFFGILPYSDNNSEKWDYVDDITRDHNNDYKDMIDEYCKKCIEILANSDLDINENTINSIVSAVNKKYIDYGVNKMSDVLYAYNNAKDAIKEIESLDKIMEFIDNSINNNSEPKEMKERDIGYLLSNICKNNNTISNERYIELEDMVSKHLEKTNINYNAYLRQMLLHIKFNNVK